MMVSMLLGILALIFWVSVFFVFYTYLGYPLIMSLLARLKPPPIPYPDYFPTVTFLIAAYNEEDAIAEKIENTLALDYPPDKFQILVAADGSSDRTPEIVKSYETRGVELSFIPERGGKMAAITRAMSSAARGEVVIISDANNYYDRQAVKILAAPFADPTVGVTTGAKLIIEDGRHLSSSEGLYWRYESSIKRNETILGTCTIAVGEILAIRREQFIPPTEKIINDDHYLVLDFIHRGYRIVYTPEARSFEHVSKTAMDEVARRTRMNAGLFQTIFMSRRFLPFDKPFVVWQIVSHKFFRAFVPFAMILAFVSNIALILFQTPSSSSWMLSSTVGVVILAMQVTFYLTALLGNLLQAGGYLGKILYLPTFLVNSNLATAKGLYSYLTNKQQHIWKRVSR
jgi:biofilm PGA synthesis N-glycosyltransferase PgaC